MEPVYECRDGQPFLTIMVAGVGVLLVCLAFFVPNDPKEPIWVSWMIRGMLVFFGLLTLIVLPVVTLKAYSEYIEVQYGLTKLIKFRLSNEKILRIEAVTYNPMLDFGGWGIKGGRGKWSKFTAFTASMTNKALAIETSERNYLIGCRDPEEAEFILRNLVGCKG